MGETRRQRIKGGKVAAAMSLGAVTGHVLKAVGDSTSRSENVQLYIRFFISCFVPSMLAAYNSFIQVTLVNEVRDVFKRKERAEPEVLYQNTEISRLPTQETECSIQGNVVALDQVGNHGCSMANI